MGISAGASSYRAVTKMDQPSNFKIATFAMGCFWHPDALFGCQKGVHRTRVGYTGGTHPNPTYRNLGDHTEAIEIDYDPDLTSYEKLLQLYWENHDPTEVHKRQYRSAIFYRDEEEKKLALDSKQKKEKLIGKPVVTAVEPFVRFYSAENYHQKYYLQTHHEKLFKSLRIKQSDLIDSTIAAKLNGYLVGLNTVDAFNAECQAFGLSPEHTDYVRQMIAKGKRSHC